MSLGHDLPKTDVEKLRNMKNFALETKNHLET